MDPITKRIAMVREGAAVERCHTLPHHGSYSNGLHQYGASMLYLQLHPYPELQTVRAILSHDLGERWCGDLPAPAKWSMKPETYTEFSKLEVRCLDHLGLAFPLTPVETRWLNAVDKLDLWLWAHEQIALGNRNAQCVIDNLDMYFMQHLKLIPQEVIDFMADYQWERSPDEIPQ